MCFVSLCVAVFIPYEINKDLQGIANKIWYWCFKKTSSYMILCK